MAGGRVKVAIVEDDPIVRRHLEEAVRSDPAFEVAVGAASLAEAQAIVQAPPDVALIDLGLPDGSGVTLIEQLRARGDTKMLVVTVFGDPASALNSFEAGADGYLLKDSAPAAVVDAIHAALAGGAPISAAAAAHLLQRVRAQPPEPGAELAALTERETELLQLFAKGLSYKEAAQSLGISRHTIGDHVKAIYRKLSVNSRAEAVYEAVQNKLIRLGPKGS